LRQRLLRDEQVRVRDVQPDAIDLEVVLDRVKLERRRLVRCSRALEARIELLDSSADLLRFGLLGADGGIGGRRLGREARRGKGDEDDRGLSLQCLDDVSRRSPGAAAPGLPHVTRSGRYQGFRMLATAKSQESCRKLAPQLVRKA